MDVLDDDGKDVDYSSGQVSELCQNLYMASARCDMHPMQNTLKLFFRDYSLAILRLFFGELVSEN